MRGKANESAIPPFPPPLVLACLLAFVNIGVKFETLAKLSQQ